MSSPKIIVDRAEWHKHEPQDGGPFNFELHLHVTGCRDLAQKVVVLSNTQQVTVRPNTQDTSFSLAREGTAGSWKLDMVGTWWHAGPNDPLRWLNDQLMYEKKVKVRFARDDGTVAVSDWIPVERV